MSYFIAFEPREKIKGLREFRKKYDPYSNIPVHITLVFPMENISKEKVIGHIKEVIQNWKPFNIYISGLTKSWDHWLFLTVKKGNKKIIKLHDDLYTKQLKDFLRKDIPYKPHIGIGFFVKNYKKYSFKDPKKLELDKSKYALALSEAKKAKFELKTLIDNIKLFHFDGKNITLVKKFPL